MSVVLNALKQQQGVKNNPTNSLNWLAAELDQKSSSSHLKRALVVGVMCLMALSGFLAYWYHSKQSTGLQVIQNIHQSSDAVDAITAFKSGSYQKSVDLFKDKLKKDPKDWITLNNLGLAYAKLGKPKPASESFFKAISINPSCASCFNNLGDLEFSQQNLKEAELYYLKAARADEAYADPQFNLGVLYEKINNPELAYKAYTEFLNLTADKHSELYQKVRDRAQQLEVLKLLED